MAVPGHAERPLPLRLGEAQVWNVVSEKPAFSMPNVPHLFAWVGHEPEMLLVRKQHSACFVVPLTDWMLGTLSQRYTDLQSSLRLVLWLAASRFYSAGGSECPLAICLGKL